MKRIFTLAVLVTLVIGSAFYLKKKIYDPKHDLHNATLEVGKMETGRVLKEGDLIFQTSLSRQSRAIQLATGSKYSHCGLIFKDSTSFYVLEAVQPVKKTSLAKWIAKGAEGKYVIKRLKNSVALLTPAVINKMKEIGAGFIGKNYDLTFDWSDDKIYCSELIWKIYQRGAGVEIGDFQKLKDFDLTNEAVRKMMAERYGNKIPLNETVISPAAIFNCGLLMTVRSNY